MLMMTRAGNIEVVGHDDHVPEGGSARRVEMVAGGRSLYAALNLGPRNGSARVLTGSL